MSLKNKLYQVFIKSESKNIKSNIIPNFITLLIVINVFAVMLESVTSIHGPNKKLFYYFEVFSVIIFTIEYLIRIWTADIQYPKLSGIKAKLKFIFSFMGLIDLLAILPFYLPMLISVDLRMLRILRLIRIFRIFKITRYSKSLQMISEVFRRKKEDLFLTLFVTFLLLLVSSCLMFYIEHDSQPEAFPNMFQSFWWAVATLTTVGYGDVYPITGMGKFMSGIIALLGIGLVALPTGIISAGFIEIMEERNITKTAKCPHCRKDL